MLKYLTEDEFGARVAGGAVTSVYREYLADRETPSAVLTRVADEDGVFLLESVTGGTTCGRYSYLGIEGAALFAEDAKVNPLEVVRKAMGARQFVKAPELPELQGGAVGYLAYDAVGTFVPRVGLVREKGTPLAAFLMTNVIVIFDSVRQTVIISYVTGVDESKDETVHAAYERAQAKIAAVYERLLSAESIAKYMASREKSAAVPTISEFQSEMTEEEYVAIVEECKSAIRAGEVIQIVPSQKFTARTTISALSLYRALRLVNPSPYNFYMRLGGRTLIGSSPEELVKLQGRTAYTSPIAGTRPRGKSAAEDNQLEEELLADPKERAEHVMLVDLGRNDLGRVSKAGTVKVASYAQVERYSHVMHLVSRVEGELDKGRDGFDLLEAAFPAGTLTGAPKVRAMEILAKLEKSPRGIYGGAAGYFSYTGDMNFAIVIRTMMMQGDKVEMRAGAGIVADSNPHAEYRETINKSKAIFEAAKFAATL